MDLTTAIQCSCQ